MTKEKRGPGESRVDRVLDKIFDGINTKLPESVQDDGQGRWSYDWCAWRRREHCFHSTLINEEATAIEGYTVVVPVNRGYCMNSTWDQQRLCEIGLPGPNSGEPNPYIDMTVAYEDGGQRTGRPDRPAAAATGNTAGIGAELERLANLHAAGALTEAEFAAAKARLLGL